jgi:hypothetical protein
MLCEETNITSPRKESSISYKIVRRANASSARPRAYPLLPPECYPDTPLHHEQHPPISNLDRLICLLYRYNYHIQHVCIDETGGKWAM